MPLMGQSEELAVVAPDFTSANDLQAWLDSRTAH